MSIHPSTLSQPPMDDAGHGLVNKKWGATANAVAANVCLLRCRQAKYWNEVLMLTIYQAWQTVLYFYEWSPP